MILGVRCNQPTFKTVTFTGGFNVVLAERTQESTDKDSRNGLGKSTLIEIIHFCLGASATKGTLAAPELKDWIFTIDLLLGEKEVSVSRDTGRPNLVFVDGDTSHWPMQPNQDLLERSMVVDDWITVLGHFMFGLPREISSKYKPSVRSLLSYFARRGRDAYSSPFEYFRKQREWDIQISNGFLLGLSWEDASEVQILKDKANILAELRKAAQAGMMSDILGSIGELEAMRIQLTTRSDRQLNSLREFRVHPQYHDLQQEADLLTLNIHNLLNENVSDNQLLSLYMSSIDEPEPNEDLIRIIYEEAGIALPDLILKRLEEVQSFHTQLILNRRSFLQTEIHHLQDAINRRQKSIAESVDRRAYLLNILNTHGALEEYSKLQRLHTETVAEIGAVEARIANLKKFEEGKNSLQVEQVLLEQRMRRDYEERSAQRGKAIALFNSNSEALYDAPGTLVVDVAKTGFKFRVDMPRSLSFGFENMKIFCYDMMLVQLWASSPRSPGFLIHDSTIFADVDERQVAGALVLAERESRVTGFQYICTFNSDVVPKADLPDDFDISAFVRLTLTDATENGSLLGIRF